ncbi:MAG: hypothetical protein R3F17_00435 [Planctomycetota bacterium]
MLHLTALWLALAPAQLPQDPAPAPAATAEAPAVDLGRPACNRIWSLVAPDCAPAPWPADLPRQELDREPFAAPVLDAWAAALARLTAPDSAPEARSAARLSLSLIAKAQGRYQDAWQHWRALADTPAAAVRALPYLWPGIAFQNDGLAGARVELAAGQVLAPAFPPLPLDGEAPDRGPLVLHFKEHLRYAGAALDLRLTLTNQGIELDLFAPGGEALSVPVTLPVPRDAALDLLYNDWERVEEGVMPVVVALPADRTSPWTVFLRLRGEFEPWPGLPRGGAAWARGRRLHLVTGDEAQGRVLAAHLGRLLGMDISAGPAPDPQPERTTLIPLPAGVEGVARLRRLLSGAETWLIDAWIEKTRSAGDSPR